MATKCANTECDVTVPTPCASTTCSHNTITDHPLCSQCRVRSIPKHRCAQPLCENMCRTEFCRMHARRVMHECDFVRQDGTKCTKMGRSNRCMRHTERGLINRKKGKEKKEIDTLKKKMAEIQQRINQIEVANIVHMIDELD